MASGRQIVVDFIGNDRGIGSTATEIESKTSKLGGTLKKVGLLAAGGLAVGVGAAGAALVGMTKNAIEDAAAHRKLAVALRNSTGATSGQISEVENWISKQGVALGVTDDELRPAFQRLVQATGDVGKAQKLASLAMDVSAGSGKSLGTVSAALAKAYDGNASSLGRLGIKTKDAQGNALSLNQIMANTSKTFKGQASAAANSLEGKMGRLRLMFDETKESIGYKLIPVATSLANLILNKIVPTVSKWAGILQDQLGPVVQRVSAWVQSLTGHLQSSTGGMSAVQAFIQGKLVPAFVAIGGAVMKMVAVVRPIVAQFVAMFGGQMSKLAPQVRQIWGSIASIIGSALSIIKSTITITAKVIQVLWGVFGKTILALTRSTLGNVVAVIRGLFGIIQGLFKVLSSVLHGDWKGAWQGIKQIVSGAKTVIVAVVRQLGAMVRAVFSALGAAMRALANAAWSGTKAIFRAGVSAVVAGVRALPGKLRALGGAMLSAGKHIIQQFVQGMKNAAGIISGIAGNVWSTLRGLINGAISKINAALSFTINLPGPDIHVNPPDIPHLAKGTRNFRGGLALVGEQGPEIVDLPQGARVTPNRESMGALRGLGAVGSRGGGDTITVVIQGSVYGVDDLTKVIETAMARRRRQTGRPLAFQPS